GELPRNRLGAKAGRGIVARVDQRWRHAVARQVIEADILEGPAELRRSLAAGLGVAAEMAGDIDQRDLAGNHCRSSLISHSSLRQLRHLGIPLGAKLALAAEPMVAGK